MVQVKGQSTHSPVGLGVPEAHQCPEDKRQKNQGEVFQNCSPPPRLITLTLSPEAPGGPGSPLGPRGPSCPGSPCGRDRFAEGSAPQPLETLEPYHKGHQILPRLEALTPTHRALYLVSGFNACIHL